MPFLPGRFHRVNTCLLLVPALTLELQHAVNKCIQGIITAAPYIDTRMNLSAALPVKDISG